MLINAIRGFCMALADSVPGVSGGTIAFLLGFYDQFINSLNNVISGTKKERKEAIIFLIKLGIGWGIGLICSVLLLSNLFHTHIYHISSLFLGLTLCAIPIVIKEEKKVLKDHYSNIIFLVLGLILVVALTYWNPSSGGENGIDVVNLNFGTGAYVFVTAMIAISAMVLPGISGSTLLLIFGLYVPVIGAVKEVLHFNLEYVPVVLVFGLGVITGILLIIKLVKICLEKFRSQSIYFILGLMIASLYAIIMGPTTLDVPKAAMTLQSFHPIFFILGIAILIVLEIVRIKLDKNERNR